MHGTHARAYHAEKEGHEERRHGHSVHVGDVVRGQDVGVHDVLPVVGHGDLEQLQRGLLKRTQGHERVQNVVVGARRVVHVVLRETRGEIQNGERERERLRQRQSERITEEEKKKCETNRN